MNNNKAEMPALPRPTESRQRGGGDHASEATPAARFSVSFRKSDGGTVVLTHLNEATATTIAADIRSAFPWLQVIVRGAV